MRINNTLVYTLYSHSHHGCYTPLHNAKLCQAVPSCAKLQDVDAVQSKLKRIGVQSIPDTWLKEEPAQPCTNFRLISNNSQGSGLNDN